MAMAVRFEFAGALIRRSEAWTRRLHPSAVVSREAIANQYLRGEGIEIGALHHPLRVLRAATVRYVDRMPVEKLRRHYPELRREHLVPVDIIDDGEHLSQIPTSSQAFVIANHFLEHCQDPIRALLNMLRVLTPGGVVYLAVPDKRYTFDQARPVTPVDHLIRDFEEGPNWSRRQHFEEWVRLVNKVADEDELLRQVSRLMEMDYSIHYHVWTQAELLELMLTLRQKMGIGLDIELCTRGGNEVVTVLRKT